ncbi:hypothetical protein D3C84_786330 [compost metagenome]
MQVLQQFVADTVDGECGRSGFFGGTEFVALDKMHDVRLQEATIGIHRARGIGHPGQDAVLQIPGSDDGLQQGLACRKLQQRGRIQRAIQKVRAGFDVLHFDNEHVADDVGPGLGLA